MKSNKKQSSSCCPTQSAIDELARLQKERLQHIDTSRRVNGKVNDYYAQASAAAYNILNGPSLTKKGNTTKKK
jgi:hypothetical protein